MDILVNNAGPIESGPFFDITDREWQRFSAGVTAGFMPGEMVHYGASKAALLGLSRGLAESVAGTGVTVNAFIPGPTHTEESS